MGMDALLKITLETKGFKTGGQDVNKTLDDTKSKTESVDVATKRYEKTLKKTGDSFKLFGLIGLGTMAALFVNTPIMAAGFNLIRFALLSLFITLQARVLPVFKVLAKWINRINQFFKEHKTITKYTTIFIGLVAAFAVGVAIIAGLSAAVLAIVGAFTILSSLLAGTAVVLVPLVATFLGLGIALGLIKLKDMAWEWLSEKLSGIKEKLIGIKDKLAEFVGTKFDKLREALWGIFKIPGIVLGAIVGTFKTWVVEPIQKLVNGIFDIKDTVWAKIKSGFMGALSWLKDIRFEVPTITRFGRSIGGQSFTPFSGFQAGGLVTRTGPILAHAGERVTPANQMGGSGDTSINIDFSGANFNVSDIGGIKQTAEEIAFEVSRVMGRTSRGIA